MSKAIKIAIIGDFNYSSNIHKATNLALEHSGNLLKVPIDYYWIRSYETISMKPTEISQYDAIWFTSGPYMNETFINDFINSCLKQHISLLVTGNAFKNFIEEVVKKFFPFSKTDKIISENLIPLNTPTLPLFDIIPHQSTTKKIYGSSFQELSNVQYSIYPDILYQLNDVIDTEAVNQFEDPTIVSVKGREFCVASMTLPQLSSDSSLPHPLITALVNYLQHSKR